MAGIRKGIFYLLIFFASTIHIFSQKYQIFKDRDLEKYGLKDSLTQLILVQPKYQSIYQLNDTLFGILEDDRFFGVINPHGRKVICFGLEPVWIETDDSTRLNELFIYKRNGKIFVDVNRNCIPYNYYPCPCDYTSILIDLPVEIVELQTAESYLCDLNADSLQKGIEFSLKLAQDYKTNPSLYYWPADVLLNRERSKIDLYDHKSSNKYFPQIAEGLDIADSLEKHPFYNIMINNYRYKIYSKYVKDKNKKNDALQKLKNETTNFKNSGLACILGMNTYFENNYAVEFGIGYNFLIGSDLKLNYINYFLGLSVERNLSEELYCYKLYLTAVQGPVNIGFYPMSYHKNGRSYPGFRPELGAGFRGCTLSYGYTFVSREILTEVRGHFLSLRYTLPIITNKEFF
jgi:hypothetical protein